MPAQEQPTPAPIDLDVDVLRNAIRDEYATVADEPTRGFHFRLYPSFPNGVST